VRAGLEPAGRSARALSGTIEVDGTAEGATRLAATEAAVVAGLAAA
jgi:hypothetical protein